MKRIFTYLGLALLAIASTTDVSAQLSDRINNPSTFRTGTRPVAGNFAFYLGMDMDQISEIFSDEEDVDVKTAVPLINLRYYKTDDLVLRAGFTIWKKKRVLEGEIDTLAASIANPFSLAGQGVGSFYEHTETEGYGLFHIGFEKHFKSSNMLDGYVGVTLPFGYSTGKDITNKGTDYSSDYEKVTGKRFGIVYGYELYFGINTFVADLPLSIGAEMGVRGLGFTSNQYNYDVEGSVGGIAYSGSYSTNNIDDFEDTAAQTTADALNFSSLKTKEFDTKGLLRFTIAYYFK